DPVVARLQPSSPPHRYRRATGESCRQRHGALHLADTVDTDRGLASARLKPSSKSVAVACLAAVCITWAVVIALILARPMFVSHDAVSNYAHVWYVSDRLWHAHRLAWRMPIIGHGRAFAFPYAFIPWLSAALARPLLGDWVVTLWLVLGCVGTAGATLWAFPELRAPGGRRACSSTPPWSLPVSSASCPSCGRAPSCSPARAAGAEAAGGGQPCSSGWARPPTPPWCCPSPWPWSPGGCTGNGTAWPWSAATGSPSSLRCPRPPWWWPHPCSEKARVLPSPRRSWARWWFGPSSWWSPWGCASPEPGAGRGWAARPRGCSSG